MGTKIKLYKPGQVICHRKYGYRGVVVAVDPEMLAADAWYNSNKSQPDREQPWYHVLVDQSDQVTYTAQSNIYPDESCQEISHPLMDQFFSGFYDGTYVRNDWPWPPVIN